MRDFELVVIIEIQIIVNYNFWALSPLWMAALPSSLIFPFQYVISSIFTVEELFLSYFLVA